MDPNVAYDVVHANNRRDTQAPISQENTAYNIHQRSLTQTDEDNEYSTVENTGYIEHNAAGDTKSTESSVLDNKSNTKRIRQKVAKNESGKKWFAILVVVAFVLSLLVAVAALVYTNIELKNQMISTNKQVQSMNEQLNNQSSQFSNLILALSSNISEQNEIIIRDLNDLWSIIAELVPMAFYPGTRIGNPASSCSDIAQDRPSGEQAVAATLLEDG